MSENEKPNQGNDCSEQPMDYLGKASEACAAGDTVLGLHLYLAAYEKAVADPSVSTGLTVAALREAWDLACELKERSMAEYVFEKLEPYLTKSEIAECASRLQELALDRLEEYGISREDLQDMADMISQDIMAGDAQVVKLEHLSIPYAGMFGVPAGTPAEVEVDVEVVSEKSSETDDASCDGDCASEAQADEPDDSPKAKPLMGIAPADDFNPYDEYLVTRSEGKSYHAATNSGSGWNAGVGFDGTTELDKRFELSPAEAKRAAQLAELQRKRDDLGEASAQSEAEGAVQAPADEGEQQAAPEAAVDSQAPVADAPANAQASADLAQSAPTMPQAAPAQSELGMPVLNYRTLVGYDEAISIMRDYGVGLYNDADFINFVQMLNERHGLTRPPAADTMFFRAPVSEDATRFVEATIGELGLPSLRMSMEEGIQGAPVLCVTAQSDNRPRMNHQHNRFEGPAVLVIDDLDMWSVPEAPDVPEGMGAFIMANMTRGAREAMNLIRAAVEDPDVFVMATGSTMGDVDPFFLDLLDPLTIVDIGYPSEKERADIWDEIVRDHPSLGALDKAQLVQYSGGMARYDLYMAARDAVEEAYKQGLLRRAYLPVSPQNIFEKLASCQPLDSDAYRALEDRVVDDFRNDLEHIEDLLDGKQNR